MPAMNKNLSEPQETNEVTNRSELPQECVKVVHKSEYSAGCTAGVGTQNIFTGHANEVYERLNGGAC